MPTICSILPVIWVFVSRTFAKQFLDPPLSLLDATAHLTFVHDIVLGENGWATSLTLTGRHARQARLFRAPRR